MASLQQTNLCNMVYENDIVLAPGMNEFHGMTRNHVCIFVRFV